MIRLVWLLAITALLGGCQLTKGEDTPLLRTTPDHGFGCANYGDGPPDRH